MQAEAAYAPREGKWSGPCSRRIRPTRLEAHAFGATEPGPRGEFISEFLQTQGFSSPALGILGTDHPRGDGTLDRFSVRENPRILNFFPVPGWFGGETAGITRNPAEVVGGGGTKPLSASAFTGRGDETRRQMAHRAGVQEGLTRGGGVDVRPAVRPNHRNWCKILTNGHRDLTPGTGRVRV